jgi:hypothetical protein
MFTKPLLWSASKVKHINKKGFFSLQLKLFLVLFSPIVAFNLRKKFTSGSYIRVAGNI